MGLRLRGGLKGLSASGPVVRRLWPVFRRFLPHLLASGRCPNSCVRTSTQIRHSQRQRRLQPECMPGSWHLDSSASSVPWIFWAGASRRQLDLRRHSRRCHNLWHLGRSSSMRFRSLPKQETLLEKARLPAGLHVLIHRSTFVFSIGWRSAENCIRRQAALCRPFRASLLAHLRCW